MQLLRQRPDLITPAPTALTTITARATTKISVHRALDGLDTLSLQLLDCLVLQAEPITLRDCAGLLGLMAAQLKPSCQRLRDLALIWGTASNLKVVNAVREALGPFPAGLGTPLTKATELADRATLDAVLNSAPSAALNVLAQLMPGPPLGEYPQATRKVDPANPKTSIEWLLAHGLLEAADADHVILPREIGLHLRGGHVHQKASFEPPAADTEPVSAETTAGSAGAAAANLTRLVAELGQDWGLNPPTVLRSGGLGVREFKRAATILDVADSVAALVIELSFSAGLIAEDGENGPYWAPTPAFDQWLETSPSQQWAQLVLAWVNSPRAVGLIGNKTEKGPSWAPLSPELDRPLSFHARADALAELATLPPGHCATASSLLERIRWRKPRRSALAWEQHVHWALAEAELLGVTGHGVLSAAGVLLTGPEPAELNHLAAAITSILPKTVDYLLLQADLSAVAPGPLVAEAAALIHSCAEVESRGGATVYRFTQASIRRALDAGHTAAWLLEGLARHSKTPIPQPLEFLIRDLARRHGLLRVSACQSYIRSEDEQLLAELLHDRQASSLSLHRIAPTVLITQVDSLVVLQTLRELGLAPVTESAGGAVLHHRPAVRRTPPRAIPAGWGAQILTSDPAAVVAAIRESPLQQPG